MTSAPPHLLSLMRTYFALNLRADQARTLLHQKLQHNRYHDVVHGPPYERVEHWSRCLRAAQLEFEAVEIMWRERADGLDEGFEERLRRGMEGLRGVLEEMEGRVEEGVD